MAPLETEVAVRTLVADAAFKRGKELVSANKLQDVSFEGDDREKATAVCEGSNPGDCYDVSVSIDPENPSKPTCKCSCPAGGRAGPCKHAIGLLLYRLKLLHSENEASPTASTDFKPKKEDDEEDTSNAVVAWVSNPVKITPNPHARRILPDWMNASVSEKPKKPRASKKQKVEEGDEGQTSERKVSTRKKTGAKVDDDGDAARSASRRKGKAKQSDELLGSDEEPVNPAKKRSPRRKASADEVEQTARSRGRNKTVAKPASEDTKRSLRSSTSSADDEDVSMGDASGDIEQESRPKRRSKKVARVPPEKEVSWARGRGRRATAPASEVEEEQVGRAAPQHRRKLKRVFEEEEGDVCQEAENDASTDAFTMDELLNIAQKNLEHGESPSSNTLNNAPAKKKTKLETTLGSCNKWRDEKADESKHLAVDLGAPRTGADGNDDNGPATETTAQYEPKQISADTLTNEMFGLMCGIVIPRENERVASPVRQIETAPVQVVSEPAAERLASRALEPVIGQPMTTLEGKPKKKSSLKEQMMRMGL